MNNEKFSASYFGVDDIPNIVFVAFDFDVDGACMRMGTVSSLERASSDPDRLGYYVNTDILGYNHISINVEELHFNRVDIHFDSPVTMNTDIIPGLWHHSSWPLSCVSPFPHKVFLYELSCW